jgi:hypothetical protein
VGLTDTNDEIPSIITKASFAEETLQTTKATKGIEHVKPGAKVVVTFSEKDGEPKISQIALGN